MSVYQWQHSCSDVFIFIPLPITLVFIPDKKTVKKVIKKVAILALFYPTVDIFERPMKHRSYLMMLPNYAFYFPLFGALETFFGARHYCVAMSNVMKRMNYVKSAYLSLCCVAAISAEPRRRVLLQWVIIIYFVKV